MNVLCCWSSEIAWDIVKELQLIYSTMKQNNCLVHVLRIEFFAIYHIGVTAIKPLQIYLHDLVNQKEVW